MSNGAPRFKRNAIPLRFFLSYLAVATIAILSAWASFGESQRVITQNAQQFSLKTMASIRDLVDERLLKMDEAINRIASYYQTNLIMNLNDPVGQRQMYKLKEYVNYLRDAVVQLSPEAYLMVYSRGNGYVFEANFACRYPLFYKEVIRGEGDAALRQWVHMMETARPATLLPAQSIYQSGTKKNVVPYVQSLPLGSKRVAGAICLFIDVNSLFSGLIDLSPSSLSYVMDTTGTVIASFTKEGAPPPMTGPLPNKEGFFTQTLNNNKMIVSYVFSERGLYYVSMTPYETIMRQANHINSIFLLTTLVCFSLCMLVAVYFMRKNVTPVSKAYRMLFAHIGETSGTSSDLKYIEQSVSKLVKDNGRLHEAMNRQNEEMHMAYYSHLLTSGFDSERELMATAAYMGVDPDHALYVVASFCILYPGDYAEKEHIARLHVIKAAIRQTLSPGASSITVIDTSANQLALVFHFAPDENDYYRVFTHYIFVDLKELMDGFQIGFKAAAGAPRTHLSDLYQAHQEALLTLDYIDARRNVPLIWYDEEKLSGQIFYYPTDVEQRLTACLRGGNTADLQALYEKVIHENTEKLHISGPMGSLLISEMKGTLLRFVKEYESDGQEAQAEVVNSLLAQRNLSFSDAAKRLEELFVSLCERVRKSSISHAQDLKQRILSYADANACNPNMALSMAAAHFNLSESYFSAFFKKHTGENFVSYITQKRLEAAREWLAKESYSIEEIAVMAGYLSAHSFRRAFKKQYGVNPTATRRG